MIIGLDHVQVAIPLGGEEQARRFYAGLLSMVEILKPVELAAREGCWFQAAGVFIHLGVQADFVQARKAHPAFVVSNLQALYDKLDQAGIEVKKDTALPDVYRFFDKDPFGNRLQFMEARKDET